MHRGLRVIDQPRTDMTREREVGCEASGHTEEIAADGLDRIKRPAILAQFRNANPTQVTAAERLGHRHPGFDADVAFQDRGAEFTVEVAEAAGR